MASEKGFGVPHTEGEILRINLRAEIIAQHNSGVSANRIAQNMGIDRKTAGKWINRYKRSEKLVSSPRYGRSKVTNKQEDELILKLARDNPAITGREIANMEGLRHITVGTVRRRLKKAGVLNSQASSNLVCEPTIDELNATIDDLLDDANCSILIPEIEHEMDDHQTNRLYNKIEFNPNQLLDTKMECEPYKFEYKQENLSTSIEDTNEYYQLEDSGCGQLNDQNETDKSSHLEECLPAETDQFGVPQTDGEKQRIVLRSEIVSQYLAGIPTVKIAMNLKVARKTVMKWIKRYKNSEELVSCPRYGRTRVTNEQEDELIVKIARENPDITGKEITKMEGLSHISVGTIRRRLRKAGVALGSQSLKE